MQEQTKRETQEIQSPNKIDFVTVKKWTNGKDTLHTFVNGIRFNCAKTDKKTGNKYFRCSFYNSENCSANFHATKSNANDWAANDLNNATCHVHENATSEHMIANAKTALKQEVHESEINKRRKDIYYEFFDKYSKSLGEKEKLIFEDKFPTYKRIKLTMWRWQKEILPRAPRCQKDLDTLTSFFYSDDGDHLVLGDHTDEFGNRILTIGDPSTLKAFSETDRLNIDCTYKTAPQPNWASILIVQVKYNTVPLHYTALHYYRLN